MPATWVHSVWAVLCECMVAGGYHSGSSWDHLRTQPQQVLGVGRGILALFFTVRAFKSQSFYVCSPFFLDLILMCWHLGIEHLLRGCRPVFGCPVGNKCAVCA